MVMHNVSLEKQIAIIRQQKDSFLRLSDKDVKSDRATEQDLFAMLAAIRTLDRLLALRQHLQNADNADEAAQSRMVKELLTLLDLPA